jgi:two-component system, cell cycle sensor histidine kinase and response regulator CckA
MIFNIGLINNASLLMALVLMYDIFAVRSRADSLMKKILSGFIIGVIGIAVMSSSWVFSPGIIFDTRSVILSVGGLFFGTIPTFIAVVMTVAYRLFQGGPGVLMGVSVIILSGAIGLLWRHFRRERIGELTHAELYLFGFVVTFVMLACTSLLPQGIAMDVFSAIVFPVLIIYPVATLIAGGLMTERLQSTRNQAALLESAAKYRDISSQFNALLDGIPDNITLMSPDLKILWANNNALARANMKEEELVGSYCYKVWHNIAEPCQNCPVVRSYKTGKPSIETITALDNRTREIRTVPVMEDGKVVHIIEVSRDVTEHKKLERQFIQSQKIESIGTLAGGVAHDFNNILTAIIGYGNMALMKIEEHDPLRKNIENILKGAERAAYLTKELLLFSRKQAGEQKPVDLIEVIRNVEKYIRRIIREDVEYKTFLQDKPLPLLADSLQLEQILINFATNAMDAMPHGGVFTVTAEQVYLNEDFVTANSYGRPGYYARITVSDTGEGMDEETLNHIFDPFFSTKEVGKGTGLGLAVVYGIIKLHDGHINVYSEKGRGTTFSIYLPLIEPRKETPGMTIDDSMPARGTETVLLAEDDDFVRTLSRVALKQFGYTVIEAVDGKDAVDKFLENRDHIHLLLFDMIMPRMNGNTAYNQIIKISPGMKVIFFSGYAPDIVQTDEEPGHNIHTLFKPLSPFDLLKKVRSVLDGDHQNNTESSASGKYVPDTAP